MRSTLRRLAVTSAAALVAAGIAVPLTAQPASAVAATERFWTLSAQAAGGVSGLYYADGATATPIAVEVSSAKHLQGLSASRDGSRIIYVRFDFERGKQEVVVRDTSLRSVRVLESLPLDGPYYLASPALSPDGTRAVWELDNDDTGSYSVRKALVGTGGPSTLAGGYSPYAFLDNDTVLMQDLEFDPFTQAFTGGVKTPVAGLSRDAIAVTVSPDGAKVAFGLDTTAPDATVSTSSMQVAPLSSNAGTWTVGAATTLDTTEYNSQPAFSRSGASLYWVKLQGLGFEDNAGNIWTRPTDGSSGAVVVASTAVRERDVVVTDAPSSDATPPGDATALPFVLNGSSPTIRWSLPADSDLSGVVVFRNGKSAYVPAPQTSWVDSGLTLGQDYTYTIKAIDRSGNYATGVTRTLTAIKPGAYFGVPTSQYSKTASFPVRFATGAKADTKFWVDYVPYGGTLKSWVTGATGAFRTFGAAASTNVAATTSLVGGTYTFRVKAEDAYGNTSGWAVGPKAVVPFDQTKATYTGGTTFAAGNAYLGSFRRLSSTAHSARVSLVGNQLLVVGWKCPSCGGFAIYDGATKIGTVSTYAASTQPRALLFSKTYAANATHTFTIRPLGTPGRPYVVLDGFAMRR